VNICEDQWLATALEIQQEARILRVGGSRVQIGGQEQEASQDYSSLLNQVLQLKDKTDESWCP
jgi:hypothetical protein